VSGVDSAEVLSFVGWVEELEQSREWQQSHHKSEGWSGYWGFSDPGVQEMAKRALPLRAITSRVRGLRFTRNEGNEEKDAI
jgi:hypothetical protein